MRDLFESGLWIVLAVICCGVKTATIIILEVLHLSMPVVGRLKKLSIKAYDFVMAKHVLQT